VTAAAPDTIEPVRQDTLVCCFAVCMAAFATGAGAGGYRFGIRECGRESHGETLLYPRHDGGAKDH
jgi:hypothetical protein